MQLDPGEDLQTPGGTGRLGSPAGSGETWSDPGDMPDATPADGTQGSVTSDMPMAASQDGTGSRSANG
jgi:hypothetical protein